MNLGARKNLTIKFTQLIKNFVPIARRSFFGQPELFAPKKLVPAKDGCPPTKSLLGNPRTSRIGYEF
jgi:hypothetical protein